MALTGFVPSFIQQVILCNYHLSLFVVLPILDAGVPLLLHVVCRWQKMPTRWQYDMESTYRHMGDTMLVGTWTLCTLFASCPVWRHHLLPKRNTWVINQLICTERDILFIMHLFAH